MADLEELLDAARRHAEGGPPLPTTVAPAEHLAILTCMDVRIDPLAIFCLRPGQAHLLRNAGARVTEDVLRSLALSSRLMEVDTVLVLGHTGCALFGVTDEELRRRTGASLDFLAIEDHHSALRRDVNRVVATDYLQLRTVAGLLYDVSTRRVSLAEVVRR